MATLAISHTIDARGLSCPMPIVKTAQAIKGSGVSHIKVSFPSAGEAAKKPRGIDRVVYYDGNRDLALIEVPVEVPALPLRRGNPPARGERVFAIGASGNTALYTPQAHKSRSTASLRTASA